MSDTIEYTEGIVYDWLISLPNDDIDDITCGNDILSAINEEAEEEMKEAIWQYIKYQLDYNNIVSKIKVYLSDQIRTAHESEED